MLELELVTELFMGEVACCSRLELEQESILTVSKDISYVVID